MSTRERAAPSAGVVTGTGESVEQPSGGGGAARSMLRGLSFEQGSSLLAPADPRAPVQRKLAAVQRDEPAEDYEDPERTGTTEDLQARHAEAGARLEAAAAKVGAQALAEAKGVIGRVAGLEDAVWAALDQVLATRGAAPAVAAFDAAADKLEIGIELIETHADVWDGFVGLGILQLFALLGAAQLKMIEKLQIALIESRTRLYELDIRVGMAKQDLVEVAAKTGMDIAFDFGIAALITSVTAVNPPLGALLAIGTAIFTWQVGNQLGVDTEGAHALLNDMADKTDVALTVGEAAFEGAKLKGACSAMGDKVAVLGVALDAWEGKQGYDRLVALKAALDAEIAKQGELVQMWLQVEPNIPTIERVFAGIKQAIPALAALVDEKRSRISELEGELAG